MPQWPKVLVVDDDETIRMALEEFLRTEQCATETAADAAEALQILGRGQFRLLITELRLKSELALPFLVQVTTKYRDMPVIVITGFPEYARREDLVPLGIKYLFVKPLDLEFVRDAIRQSVFGPDWPHFTVHASH